MSRLIGFLLSLIGYACVATVVTAALGYGYLRKSGKLDDETMFRIVALVHGVDLEEIAKAKEKSPEGTPPEEPSFKEQQEHSQTASLQFDAKRKQLADSLVNFDYQLQQLNVATNNYSKLKAEVADFLQKQGALVSSEYMQKVRTQIESLVPKKQAKPLLISYITDNRIDEVIILLNGMKPRTQEAILKTFDTKDDLDMLYRIQRKMLAGEPVKPLIDARLKDLEQLNAQQK